MNRRILAGAMLGAMIFGGGAIRAAETAQSNEPTQQELLDKVKELQAKVEKLEAQQREKAMRAADVDRTVNAIMQDSGSRSQFMATETGGFVGYDEENGQFLIESADKRFLIHPYMMLQPRAVVNSFDNGTRDTDGGGEIARARLGLDGNAFLEGLYYRVQWETGSSGGFALQDAYILFKMSDDMWLRVGQYKNPLSHEYRVDESKQLAVDRSLLDASLGGTALGRTQGVAMVYDPGGQFRGELSLDDGALTANTPFLDGTGGFGSDMGIGVRADYMLFGQWKDYDDLTAHDTQEQLLVIGGGAEWSQSGDSDIRTILFDAQWETPEGIVVSGTALVSPSKVNGQSTTSYGASAQIGYMIDRKWEAFGRVGITKFDDLIAPGPTGEDTFPEIAGGFNYYFGEDGSFGNRFKLTVDITALPNGSTAIAPLDFVSSADFELVLRSQITFKI